MQKLHWRSIAIGFVLGAASAAVLFMLTGERLRGSAASATEALGEEVQRAGEKIERTGEKLR